MNKNHSPIKISQNKEIMKEDFGESMIIDSQSQKKRKPGEVRLDEVEPVDRSILASKSVWK